MRIANNIKKTASNATVAALISGVSIVGGVGTVTSSAMDMPQGDNAQHSAMMANPHSQAAENLRVSMNNLLREHVTTSLDATRAIAGESNQANIDAATNSQYANSDALSAAVGSVYGGEAQAKFSTLFREHIYESNKYAMAIAAGDDSGKQAAVQELQVYLHQISEFFSSAIPGLQAQDVYGMLNEHEELINKSTDAFKAGDYVQSYQLEREGLKQISMAADALSSGIIATQPAKFQ